MEHDGVTQLGLVIKRELNSVLYYQHQMSVIRKHPLADQRGLNSSVYQTSTVPLGHSSVASIIESDAYENIPYNVYKILVCVGGGGGWGGGGANYLHAHIH